MKIENDKIYVIYHKPTGKFKCAGHNKKFSRTGKLWTGSTIKQHLRLYENYSVKKGRVSLADTIDDDWSNEYEFGDRFPIDECEIVEFKLVELKRESLRDFIDSEIKNI